MAKQVDLRSSEVKLRSFTLNRSVIRQAKRLRSIPKEFRDGSDVNDKCVGYVHGSAIGEDEHTLYLLFVHEDDLYLYGWPAYAGKAKQLYV